MSKATNFGRHLFDRHTIESDWWFNGVRFITRLVYCLTEGFLAHQHGRAIKPKNELEAKVLSSRDLKVSSEEGKSLLDDGALLEDHPATPSTDDASVDYDLCKSTDKKKMMRLTSPPPISFDTQSVDHIATGEAVATRKRRSITPESSEQINMKPGSQSSRGKRLGLTMEDYYEWEDIQDLFRAPPGAIATYTCVEGHEIEEYKVILSTLSGTRSCYFCAPWTPRSHWYIWVYLSIKFPRIRMESVLLCLASCI